MSESTKRIEIIRGEEFRPYVADKFNNTDYFADVYCTAADCVKDIVSASKAFGDNDSHENSEYDQYLNNIVAFCGERGQGKTGALLTFRKLMIEYNDDKNKAENPLNVCGECQFTALDVIDPSMFDDDSNILQVIIARMFHEFKEKCESSSKNQALFNKQRNVMDKFQKVFGFINKMMKPKKTEQSNFYDDSADALIDISDTVNLRVSMHDLVKGYLDFMNSYEGAKFLVIPVDDIDVNIEYAYKMAEQLRKYLIIPNVVILMALKVEQLAEAIVNRYVKLFARSDTLALKNEIDKMAERYIEKLLPNGRKIYLPDIRIDAQSDEDNIEIIYFSSRDAQKRYYDPEKVNKECDILCRGKGVQQTALNYIYKKTTLAFVKPKFGVHPLVPETLRELTGLFAVLSHMEGISNDIIWNISDEEREQKKIIENDLTIFENYFINTWVSSKLNEGNAEIIRELNKTNDFEKHRYIITKIYDMLYNYKYFSLKLPYKNDIEEAKPLSKTDVGSDVTEFSKKTANPLLYSLGDVMDAIARLMEIINDSQTTRFVCAVRVIYAITMHRLSLNSNFNFNEDLAENCSFVGEISSNISNTDYKYDKEKYKAKIKEIKAFCSSFSNYQPNLLFQFIGGDLFGNRIDKVLRLTVLKGSRAKFAVNWYKRSSNYILDHISTSCMFSTMQEEEENELNYMKKYSGLVNKASFNISYAMVNFIDLSIVIRRLGNQSADYGYMLPIISYSDNNFKSCIIFSAINPDCLEDLFAYLIERRECGAFKNNASKDKYPIYIQAFYKSVKGYFQKMSEKTDDIATLLKKLDLSKCTFLNMLIRCDEITKFDQTSDYDAKKISNVIAQMRENVYQPDTVKSGRRSPSPKGEVKENQKSLATSPQEEAEEKQKNSETTK